MKKIYIFLITFVLIFLSGCTWLEVNKGIDDTEKFYTIMRYLDEKIPNVVTTDIELPTKFETIESKIDWTSSNQKIISNEGKFFSPNENIEVILTATITLLAPKEKDNVVRTYTKVVTAMKDDTETNNLKFLMVKEWLDTQIPTNTVNDIILPTSHHLVNCTIEWKSSNINIINTNGKVTTSNVTQTVDLTAIIILENNSISEWTKKVVVNSVNNSDDENKAKSIRNYLDNTIPSIVYEDILLPSSHPTIDSYITWKTSDESILSSNGKYGIVVKETIVYLTATIKLDNQYLFTHTLSIVVVPNDPLVNEQQMDEIKNWLDSQINSQTSTNIPLASLKHPTIDATISWQSSHNQYMNNNGEILDKLVTIKITLTATITLKNNYQDTFVKEVLIIASSDQESEQMLDAIEIYVRSFIPEYIGANISLPYNYPFIEGSKIRYESSHSEILSNTGEYTYPSEETKITLFIELQLPNGRSRYLTINTNALPEGAAAKVIQEVINEIKFNFKDNVFSTDIPKSYLITSYKDASILWTSNNNSICDGSGKITRPTYDKKVILTAKIDNPGLNTYYYDVEILVRGIVPIPEPANIQLYLEKLIGKKITSNIYLPGKYNEADAKGIVDNVKSEDIKLIWSVTSGDPSILVNNNQIIRKTYDVHNVTLTAKLIYNDLEIGTVDLYNITIEKISISEILNYANKYIIANLPQNVTSNTVLPTTIDKYGLTINWSSSKPAILSIENGVITVYPNAGNQSTALLIAKINMDANEIIEFSYEVGIIANNKVLSYPDSIKDQDFYNFLKSYVSNGAPLTVDAFLNPINGNNKYLDLSYDSLQCYFTDLTGIEYFTDLRWLNISGQNKIKDFSFLKSLKNLEVLIARDCDLTSLTVNGFSIINEFPRLYALDLSNNELESIDELRFIESKKLEYLYLSNNKISNISVLSKFDNLRILLLDNNKVSDVSSLENMRFLHFLYLNNNCISDISSLNKLTNLKTLRLDNQETVKGDGKSSLSNIDALERITQLQYLYIQNNIIDDIDCLANKKNLIVLNASNNHIQNINIVRYLTELRFLNLENNDIYGTTVSVTNLFKLETLLLEGNNFTAGDYFSTHVNNLKKLVHLSISSSNEGFKISDLSFIENMDNLIYLSIPYCNISSSITKLANGTNYTINNLELISNKNLIYLDISGNLFEDISILDKLTSLEHLFINDLNLISLVDSKDMFIVSNYMSLKTLSMVNCNLSSLTVNGDKWLYHFDSLKYLNISYNKFNEIDIVDINSNKNKKNLVELYIDSSNNYIVKNIEQFNEFIVLRKLSMINAQINKVPKFNNSLEYLNISSENVSNFDSLYLNNGIKTLIINGIEANFEQLKGMKNLEFVYLTQTNEKNNNFKNLETMKYLVDNGVHVIINDSKKFIPNAYNDASVIFNKLLNYDNNKMIIDLGEKIVKWDDDYNSFTYKGFDFSIEVNVDGSTYKKLTKLEELCNLLDGKESKGILDFILTTSLYNEEVNINFKMQYEIKKMVKVEYFGYNQELLKEEIIDYGHSAKNISLNIVGYTFYGWYEDNDFTNQYDFSKVLYNNEKIYAKLAPNKYKIIFNVNGIQYYTKEFTYDFEYDFSNIIPPEVNYYKFVGWGISSVDLKHRTEEVALYNIIPSKGSKFNYANDLILSPVLSQIYESYYYISNYSDLINIDPNAHSMLINDIEIPNNFDPIKEFKGILEGNNHKIIFKNDIRFNIDDQNDNVHGTFINNNKGEIRNLKIEANFITTWSKKNNSAVNHSGTYLVYNGCVVGINHKGAVIDNVQIVVIKGMTNDRNNSTAGGIAGENNGTIKNCKANVHIYSTGDTGGITGRNSGLIDNCYFDGSIGIYVANNNGGKTVRSWGGVVGYSYDGEVKNCNNIKVKFNYYGENEMYHNYTIFKMHSYCDLQIKVGTIIGHKSKSSKMNNCSAEKGCDYLNKLGGNFHDGKHEREFLFANENGKIGRIS